MCAVTLTVLLGLSPAAVPLRGLVVAAENSQPLFGARVHAQRARRTVETDRYGRFVIWIDVLPDTLVARVIGRRPDTIIVQRVLDTSIIVLRLEPSPTPLAALTVYGEAAPDPGLDAAPARWDLPRAAVEAVPAAVEGDVLRSLVLSPAVAYSSPLSAQPLVRGQDAAAAGYRLDGFTLLNPYHVGRYLGAVFPGAVQAVAVVAGPFGEEWGDATSAIIDAQLRAGGDEPAGGVQASFVTLAGWIGGPLGVRAHAGRWFVAGRHAYLGDLPVGPLQDSPYAMEDAYGRFLLGTGPGALRLTVFASRDRLFNRETGAGLHWSNRLVGVRLPLNVAGAGRLEVWGEVSAFTEDVIGVPVRGEPLDVTNRFGTAAAGARLRWSRVERDASVGVEVRDRWMRNRFAGGALAPPDVDARGLVATAFGGASLRRGPVAVHLGVRVDGDSGQLVAQPRGRLSAALGRAWRLAAGAGRTARLYQVIADPAPEPEPLFYDIWRPGGTAGEPSLIADHATLDVERALGEVGRLRGSLFYTRLRGVGEVAPLAVAGSTALLRFGQGLAWGLDVEASFTGARLSASAAYVLSRSERRWGDAPAFVAWRHDRRHQGRVFMAAHLGKAWRLTLLADVSSAEPLTPVVGVVAQSVLTPAGPQRDARTATPALIFGDENSARGAWVGHADVALAKNFRWGGARGAFGLSILNASLTRVARLRPELGTLTLSPAVRYAPAYTLPPVPTVTFRLEF